VSLGFGGGGEAGADALADVGIVEAGPGGGFALAGPEESEEAPVLGFGCAAAGERGLEERLHAQVGGVGIGDEFQGAGVQLVKLALGFLEESLGDAEAAGTGLELNGDAGAREVPAGWRDLSSSLLVEWRSKRARAAAWRAVDLPDSLGAERTLRPGEKGPRRTISRKRPTWESSREWRITRSPPEGIGRGSGGGGRTTRA
jgi:hypothetical protein